MRPRPIFPLAPNLQRPDQRLGLKEDEACNPESILDIRLGSISTVATVGDTIAGLELLAQEAEAERLRRESIASYPRAEDDLSAAWGPRIQRDDTFHSLYDTRRPQFGPQRPLYRPPWGGVATQRRPNTWGGIPRQPQTFGFEEPTKRKAHQKDQDWGLQRVIYPSPHISPTIRAAVISALKSLYADSLRPTFIELKRRLQERRISGYVLKDLPALFRSLDKDVRADFRTKEVFLINEPVDFKGFVDPKNPVNPFECCVWRDFTEYIYRLMQAKCWTVDEAEGVAMKTRQMLESKPGGTYISPNGDNLLHYQFEGGRYGMATKMRNDWRLKSSRLKALSLGHLCHLVQLSIAAGIMQYETNILQPRATCLRISAAFAQSDIEPERQATQREAIRDTVALQHALRRILREYPEGILLSQLKCRFASQLSSRLCQSVFGCTRLSNLLQLPDFEDVCRLITDNQGRVNAQSTEYPVPPDMTVLQREKEESQIKSGEMKLIPQSGICIACREAGFPSYTYWQNFPGVSAECTSAAGSSMVPQEGVWPSQQNITITQPKATFRLESCPGVVRSAIAWVGCM